MPLSPIGWSTGQDGQTALSATTLLKLLKNKQFPSLVGRARLAWTAPASVDPVLEVDLPSFSP